MVRKSRDQNHKKSVSRPTALVNTAVIFGVFGLTRPGIELESIVLAADALSTQRDIFKLVLKMFHMLYLKTTFRRFIS